MTTRLLAWALLCALLATSVPPSLRPALAQPLFAYQPGQPVPINDRLGLAFISSAELKDVPPQRYQQALNAGVRWNRWPIYWGEVVKNGGYGLQDANAVRDHQFGIQIDAILIQTPDQFSTIEDGSDRAVRVGERAPYEMSFATPRDRPKSTGAPRNLYQPLFLSNGQVNPENYWGAFVYQTVSRYKPGGELARQQGWSDGWGIRHWEIWNEADSGGFWLGSVQDYYQLLKVGYQAVKAADPEAQVLLSGLAYWMNKTWFQQLLEEMDRDPDQAARKAANSYFDILPLHWYSQPVLLYDKTSLFRGLLRQHGLGDKPIWINEANVPVYGDPGAPSHPSCVGYHHSASLEEQANFVIQAVAYALAAGVERVFLFQHYDDGNGEAFGMFRNNGEPRPAYGALQLASAFFRDARNVVRETRGPVEHIHFFGTQQNGALARLTVAWALDPGARTTWLDAIGPAATLIRRDGAAQPLPRSGERYIFSLPRATALDECEDPKSGYIIGGDPAILLEPIPADPAPPSTRLLGLADAVCDVALVRWASTPRGWGVLNWDVEVRDLSTPNAPWRRWLTETTQRSGAFKGEAGRPYAFRARARDYSGLAEPFPEDGPRTTINACPPRIPGGGMLRNGSFEEPDLHGWALAGSTAPQAVNDARSGGWAMALGLDFVGQPDPPMNGGGNSTASQQIAIPAGAPHPFLGYWYAIEGNPPAPSSPDWHTWPSRLEVIVIDAQGKGNYVDVLWQPTDWSYRTVDLAPWRGQQVSIVFNLWQASAAFTTVARLDDVGAWSDRLGLPIIVNGAP